MQGAAAGLPQLAAQAAPAAVGLAAALHRLLVQQERPTQVVAVADHFHPAALPAAQAALAS